jgi:hypothetical protein
MPTYTSIIQSACNIQFVKIAFNEEDYDFVKKHWAIPYGLGIGIRVCELIFCFNDEIVNYLVSDHSGYEYTFATLIMGTCKMGFIEWLKRTAETENCKRMALYNQRMIACEAQLKDCVIDIADMSAGLKNHAIDIAANSTGLKNHAIDIAANSAGLKNHAIDIQDLKERTGTGQYQSLFDKYSPEMERHFHNE